MVQKQTEPLLVHQLLDRNGNEIVGAPSATPIAGSSAAATVLLKQDRVRKVTVTLDPLSLAVTEALDYGSVAFVDLGDTNMMLLACESDLVVTKGGVVTGIVAATDLDMAIGTAAASATTLATTMENVLDKLDVDALGLVVDFDGHSSAATTMPLVIASGAANKLYINAVPIGGILADDTLSLSGTVTLYYIDLGNVTS